MIRIVFEPIVHPDGQTQFPGDDVLAPGEVVELIGSWVQIRRRRDMGSAATFNRAYPSHVVSQVVTT